MRACRPCLSPPCGGVAGHERCVFTQKTLHALRTQANKAQFYRRPQGLPRYMVLGQDGRGLNVYCPLDGTNKVESDFHKLETALSASSYAKEHGHGLLMASAQRLSIKGNIAAGILSDPGHCDLQLLRMRNQVAAKHGLPLPFPDVPPLSADTGARFGCDYCDLELRRQAGEENPIPKPIKLPSIEPFYQQYEPSSTDKMFMPVEETGLIDWRKQRHNNPCIVGGPCCKLRKIGSCLLEGKHVKHKHVPGCPKLLGNEQKKKEQMQRR